MMAAVKPVTLRMPVIHIEIMQQTRADEFFFVRMKMKLPVKHECAFSHAYRMLIGSNPAMLDK
jgi:hypothetical protein